MKYIKNYKDYIINEDYNQQMIDIKNEYTKLKKGSTKNSIDIGVDGKVSDILIKNLKETYKDGKVVLKDGHWILQLEDVQFDDAKEYINDIDGESVKGYVSNWNKGSGEWEGLPVVYFAQSVNMKTSWGVFVGILKDDVIINITEANDNYFKYEADAMDTAKQLAENENYEV